MAINRVEILRDRGESLFIGPGAFGIIPIKGVVNRNNLVLKHRIPLDGSTKFLRQKGFRNLFLRVGARGFRVAAMS